MPRSTAAVIFVCAALAIVPARADDPLAGVVLDQTVTVAGHAFYQTFCMFWHDKPMSDMFAVAVRELPSARRGSQVVVEHAGRTVFRNVLPPARAEVAPLSQQAVDLSYDAVANAEVGRLLFSQDELAPDEF